MTHQCPVKTCDQTVPDEMLMCRSHWHMLSMTDKHAVWDSYNENGGGQAHIRQIAPIIDRLNERVAPKRNQGKPFGL